MQWNMQRNLSRTLATAIVFLGLAASPLAAMEPRACLTRPEQQAAVAAKQAVPLAAAFKAVHGRARQVVRARQNMQETRGGPGQHG